MNTTPSEDLRGTCHCGAIEVSAQLSTTPDNMTLRECDCSFCIKHGASYLSDAQGSLHIKSKLDSLHQYRQYSDGVADFLLCKNCGVLIAVTYSDSTTLLYGAVNSKIFHPQKFKEAVQVSPQKLSQTEKIERWKSVWFKSVQLE